MPAGAGAGEGAGDGTPAGAGEGIPPVPAGAGAGDGTPLVGCACLSRLTRFLPPERLLPTGSSSPAKKRDTKLRSSASPTSCNRNQLTLNPVSQ